MGFWELERIVMQFVFLAVIGYGILTMRRLFLQGQVDRKARERAIKDLSARLDRIEDKDSK